MFSSLNTSVSGVNAHDYAMSNISSNIANVSSVGYKGVYTAFKTLVNSGYYYNHDHGYNNGVITKSRTTISMPGFIEDTGIVTDLAVKGEGMFIVNSNSDGKGENLYTREGSFRKDKLGNFVNIAGAYLMALPLLVDNSKVSSVDNNHIKAIEDLEVVNVNDFSNEIVPTSKLNVNLNLNAAEDYLLGSRYHIKSSGLSIDDIIYDKSLHIDSGFRIVVNKEHYDFNYGGFTAGNRIIDNEILGADKLDSKFSVLRDGDNLTIKTRKLGNLTFSYKGDKPAIHNKEFNSMLTLKEAINSTEVIKASIIDGMLLISPENANEELQFISQKRLLNSGDVNVYGEQKLNNVIHSIDLNKESVYGITPNSSTAVSQVFKSSNGATDNDGIVLTTDTGNKYELFYKEGLLPTDADNFNSLATLAEAITKKSNGELKATINGGLMTIDSNDDLFITSIDDLNIKGRSNFASTLGLKHETQFAKNVTDGDKLNISFGYYSEVNSRNNIPKEGALPSSILTSFINSIDFSTDSAFGITRANPNPLEEVFTKQNGSIDDDGINIKLSDGSSHSFIYQESGGGDKFNSLKTLSDLINKNSNGELQSQINGNGIVINTVNKSVVIADIENINNDTTNKADFASKLKLKKDNWPKVNDEFSIKFSNGLELDFKFVDNKSPDYKIGEFNNIDSLIKAINHISRGELISSIKNDKLNIKIDSNKSVNTIYSINNKDNFSKLADFLNIKVDSKTLELQYVDKFKDQGNGGFKLPDTLNGEFNNIVTLRRAINESSNGLLRADFDYDKKSMSIRGVDGVNINYIKDNNINGSSNFANNLGLDYSDIVSSLGFKDIVGGKDRFAKVSDIASMVNEKIPELTRDINSYQGLNNSIDITAKSVFDKFSFENLSEIKNDKKYDDFLTKFGLSSKDNSPVYIIDNSLKNMASGNIKPHFTTNVSVIDSLGFDHSLAMSFLKVGVNQWVCEVYSANQSEINNSRDDGLVAYAILNFDGEGKINKTDFYSVKGDSSSHLEENIIDVNWSNGANASSIELNMNKRKDAHYTSTEDLGIVQVSDDYKVNFLEQNGLGAGDLKSLDIDESGVITLGFTNGAIKEVYQIPLVTFHNPEGLTLLTGNLYAESEKSGIKNMHSPGKDKVGLILSSSLENPNVEISKELTKMIPIQHAYQANTRVIQVINKLLGELYVIFSG